LVPLSTDLQTQIGDLARSLDWLLVVLFGSTAREGTGRDLDIAVLVREDIDLFTQADWLEKLAAIADPIPVDLVLITNGLSPLTRFEIFRHGRCLYEREAGLFDREWDRAFFLHADSEWLRRRAAEALHGSDQSTGHRKKTGCAADLHR
jgi:predicted nucleotidyltransferase